MGSIWVIGKNISIDTFPKGLFGAHETVGINQAAIVFRTTWAFSVYPFVIDEILNSGFALENVIGGDPEFNIPGQESDYFPHKHPGLLNYLRYNNRNPAGDNDAAPDCEAAMRGGYNCSFHNTGTALHLVLHWCVIRGFRKIELFGCNQTMQSGKDFEVYPMLNESFKSLVVRRRAYLDVLINEYKRFGANIVLYEDFEDYKAKGGEV